MYFYVFVQLAVQSILQCTDQGGILLGIRGIRVRAANFLRIVVVVFTVGICKFIRQCCSYEDVNSNHWIISRHTKAILDHLRPQITSRVNSYDNGPIGSLSLLRRHVVRPLCDSQLGLGISIKVIERHGLGEGLQVYRA